MRPAERHRIAPGPRSGAKSVTTRVARSAFAAFTDDCRYYEAVQSVPGVNDVSITEFRPHRVEEPQPAPALPLTGRIPLGNNEIPVIPADEAYTGGTRIPDEDCRAGGQRWRRPSIASWTGYSPTARQRPRRPIAHLLRSASTSDNGVVHDDPWPVCEARYRVPGGVGRAR